ncbi:hypothetical protein [Paenibacillus cremeus]|uniref:Uncharacterized protein n=1 Tax=Paenibacillus cremeus TaxID=2163881 RepID=A0A559KCT1_9BACL|nr:hypothetical protein [Paenibacillus cremeus]TVY09935.1 hypothetical protein FPZ49_11225 [Paenibacillus cremeus]
MTSGVYKQINIEVQGTEIPFVFDEIGIRWWPLGRLNKFILGRSLCSDKEMTTIYKHHFKFFDIRYTPKQPKKSTTYISEHGLIEILVKTNIARLTAANILDQNKLHEYLGIHTLHITERLLKSLKKKKVKNKKWTKRMIIKEIKKRQQEGLSLSSASVQKEYRSLHDAAINNLGSWQNAISEAGLDYEEIREDAELLRYCGIKFEKLLGDILRDVYQREVPKGYDHHARPDFVVEYGDWIDAKLSVWTNSINETIDKYELYCHQLTIIYLRGNKNIVKYLTEKTKVMSVYKYIKRLSRERQDYYIPILNKLYTEANNIEEEERQKVLSVE